MAVCVLDAISPACLGRNNVNKIYNASRLPERNRFQDVFEVGWRSEATCNLMPLRLFASAQNANPTECPLLHYARCNVVCHQASVKDGEVSCGCCLTNPEARISMKHKLGSIMTPRRERNQSPQEHASPNFSYNVDVSLDLPRDDKTWREEARIDVRCPGQL
jgi:hypothetical protein